jgi:glycosyltransferase involved in cell wall biosynthesis
VEGTVVFPQGCELVWIYPMALEGVLHNAPRLEMTKELRNIGWQITFLTPGLAGNHLIDGVEVTGIPCPKIFILGQLIFHLRITKYVLRHWNAIDFVLFHETTLPWILFLQLIRNITGCEVPLFVLDSRTVPMEGKSATWRDRLRNAYFYFMRALVNRLVDGQTSITQRMAEELNIPKRRLWGTWPSGVDLDAFYPAKIIRVWPKEEEAVRVVYLGVMAPGRNLLELCRAVDRANREGMRFELSLIGSGKEYDKLVEFASRTDGKVQVLPPIPHSQAPQALSRMHVGALPFADEQKFRVSSPIKLFEYMGSGMPILATRIVCHTDVILDHPCAFWAEDASADGLFSALREVWGKRAKLKSMGDVALDVAKEYTWIVSAKKLTMALKEGLVRSQKRVTVDVARISK